MGEVGEAGAAEALVWMAYETRVSLYLEKMLLPPILPKLTPDRYY